MKSVPLDQYLRLHDSQQRLHLDDDYASLPLIERLMPDAYPNSCWPSERHLGLVHSQQLAVNTILSTLADSQGLLGINGPPDTGKTTLLRDLIAAIITSRADELAKLHRASDGFEKNGCEKANDGSKQQACFKLNSALYGFEIVVASYNNGAVENITLELPQRDKIDESWLPAAEYFADLGELISGKPAWGLISGALGSKVRRKNFVDCYFFGQRPFGNKKKTGTKTEDTESDEEVECAVDTQTSELSTLEEGGISNANRDNALPEKVTQGLMGWLNSRAKVNTTRSSEQRQALWRQAVSDYEAVKTAALKACEDTIRIRELIESIQLIRKKMTDQSESLIFLEKKLADALAQLTHLDSKESRPANLALKQCLDALKRHQAIKPGFWTKLFSLWKAQHDWHATQDLLEDERNLAAAEFARIKRLTKQLEISRESLEKQTTEAHRTLLQLQGQEKDLRQHATDLASAGKAHHLIAWLQSDTIGRGDAIELSEPWHIEGWRQARARVFIQALKLHQTFLELEASRIRSNLFLINGLLTSSRFQGLSRDAIRSAWASLFMVVPVLSSTFASFARSFGTLGASEIGWLLVDEAGQARRRLQWVHCGAPGVPC